MGLWPSAFIAFFAILHSSQQTRKWVVMESKGQGSFILANEYGIVPSSRNSIVFSIKACSDAVVVISDIASITNIKGHYFLAMIGNKKNTETQVMDSCFTCERTTVVKGPLLDCKVFKSFWMLWDGEGLFKMGQGTVVGREVYLTLQGKQGKYMGNFIQVTSTQGVTANFRFSIETPPRFVSPLPDGSTLLYVNETEAVDTDLLQVKVSPQSLDAVLSVNGDGAEDFDLVNRTLRIGKQLDYETRQYYTLTVGSDEGFAAGLTISVLDENDETPSLTVFHVDVPEEIPVGTVIGGFYNVIDRDKGDNLTFSLSGEGSDLFLALGKGHLKLIKHLDREGSDGIQNLDSLTLTVTDLVGHNTSDLLNITVVDVNDNSPVCEPAVLNFSVTEGSAEDVELLNLTSVCNDQDSGDNGKLTFSILGETWVTSVFSVRKDALIARAGGLDRENSTQRSTIVFFVQAQDSAQSGARRKTYIQVTVKVLPVNEFAPVWRSLKKGQTDEFQPITVTSATPVGMMITSLAATDGDKGDNPLVYSIISITTDSGSDGLDFLQIDSSTGYVTVKNPLTGVKALLVHAQASDGNHTIQAKLTVSVLDGKTDKIPSINITKSNPPPVDTTSGPVGQETDSQTTSLDTDPNEHSRATDPNPHSNISHPKLPSQSYFDRRLYHIPIPSTADIGRSVLNFTVRPLLSAEVLVVEMPAGKYFSVQKSPHWHLIYTSTSFSKRTIPTVIPLFVKNRVTKEIVDEAYVVIKPAKCDLVTLGQTLSKPVVNRGGNSGTSGRTERTGPFRNVHTHTPECGATLSMTSRTLVAVSAIQGLALGGILAVFAYKKFTRGKKQSTVVPERKEPLGSDDVFKHSEFPEKSSKLPEILTQAERGNHKLEEQKPLTEPCDTVIELDSTEVDQKPKTSEECDERGLPEEGGTDAVMNKGEEENIKNVESSDHIEDKERGAGPEDECQKNEDNQTVLDDGLEQERTEQDIDIVKHDEEGIQDLEQSAEQVDELADMLDQSELQFVRKEGDNTEGTVCDETYTDRCAGIDDALAACDTTDTIRKEATLVTVQEYAADDAFIDFLNTESDPTQTRGHQPDDLLTGCLNAEVVAEDKIPEFPKPEESLAVPDNSEASAGEEPQEADDDDEEDDDDDGDEEEEEEEKSEDDDTVGDAAETAGITAGVAGTAAVAGVVGVTVKKRRKIKKVKKEKPKKEKKPKLRKIDFTQSPYCFPTKESKE